MQKLKIEVESEKERRLQAVTALEKEQMNVDRLKRELAFERDQVRSLQTQQKSKVYEIRTALELEKSRAEEMNR